MLHILWMIIKFILILLGIVLGLILLAVLLILFCPVRYSAYGMKEQDDWKQVTGQVRISWLLHAVSLKASWREGNLETVFCLFGIPVSELLKKRRLKKAHISEKKKEISGTTNTEKKQNIEKKRNAENVPAESVYKERTAELPKTEEHVKSKPEIQIKPEVQKQITKESSAEKTISQEKKQRRNPFSTLISRIKNIFQGIRGKLHHIRLAVRKITGNISWWKEFLEHPRVKAAISLVWKNAKFLIRHVLPTRTSGEITFSCEDPAVTGSILAVLGMTIPFHKNCVQITPLFQGENYFRGNIKIKGRIYGFVFIKAAIVIYFNKNIKYVIKRWKTRRA